MTAALRLALPGLLLASAPLLAAPELTLAMREEGAIRLWHLPTQGAARARPAAEAAALRTPLGSLWKLFVHAYLEDRGRPTPDFLCRGQDRDEVYCCEPGESIGREQALLRSCGPYYAPARLGIGADEWRDYWQARAAPPWLQQLAALGPATEVAVDDLLLQLERLPARASVQRQLAAALLGQPDPVFDALGAQLRIKTWSWHRGEVEDRIGGFAGWLSDGRAVWAMAAGTSRSVLHRHAAALARQLPPAQSLDAGECVEVRMFARYPIRRIEPLAGAAPAHGALRGRYRLHFASGNAFEIESHGELLLGGSSDAPVITARLSREDYVARVLEREAATEPVAAARALALVIRSYLAQHAETGERCLRIEDSSARQRVLARPPSAAARSAAAFSEGLVLSGVPVRYHLEQSAPGQLSWRQAETDARHGAGPSELLRRTWPRAERVAWGQARSDCQPLPEAVAWLAEQRPSWRRLLQGEAGYEERADAEVCRLAGGRPFVDRARARLHVRGVLSQQDRLDLTHEYLHLAFEAHPHGHDEHFIETWARRLVLGH